MDENIFKKRTKQLALRVMQSRRGPAKEPDCGRTR